LTTEEKLFYNALGGTTKSLRTINLIFNMETYEFTYTKTEAHKAYTQYTVYKLKCRFIIIKYYMYIPVAIGILYYFSQSIYTSTYSLFSSIQGIQKCCSAPDFVTL
jgi:hypothetical protein